VPGVLVVDVFLMDLILVKEVDPWIEGATVVTSDVTILRPLVFRLDKVGVAEDPNGAPSFAVAAALPRLVGTNVGNLGNGNLLLDGESDDVCCFGVLFFIIRAVGSLASFQEDPDPVVCSPRSLMARPTPALVDCFFSLDGRSYGDAVDATLFKAGVRSDMM
jgi:hypothetical protein